MKKFLSILAVAALACVTMVSCSDDDDYMPGPAEDPSCYGVYFPAQDTSFELDPAEPTSLTFKAARTNDADEITVPVSINMGGDVFTVSEINFAEGQTETTFTVSFPKAEVGVTYKFDMSIDDPRYAKVYGSVNSGLWFSVTRVKWNVLGTGDYYYYGAISGVDEGLTLEQRDGTTQYRIQNWGYGVTFFFFVEDGQVALNPQYFGLDIPQGPVWLQMATKGVYGTYDEETKTYSFPVQYFINGTSLGFAPGEEYFVLTDPVE